MNESRGSTYAFAECTCGGVFQSQSPVDWGALADWERLFHCQTGHDVSLIVPPRYVYGWRNGRMERVTR